MKAWWTEVDLEPVAITGMVSAMGSIPPRPRRGYQQGILNRWRASRVGRSVGSYILAVTVAILFLKASWYLGLGKMAPIRTAPA
jgi:hypothetical protein